MSAITRGVTSPISIDISKIGWAGFSRAVTGRWWNPDAVFDADYQNSRFRFGGQTFETEASWLTAMSGSKIGNATVVGPLAIGPQLAADPTFTNGVDGFAASPSFPEGSVSHVAGRLRTTATGANGANTFRASKSVSSTRGLAYRYALTYVSRSDTNVGSLSINAANSADMFGSASLLGDAGNPPQNLVISVGAQSATTWFGIVQTTNLTFPSSVDWDNQDIREAIPYTGYTPGSLTFEISGTMPASQGSGKVVLQWGNNREAERVRLVWDSSKNLRLIVTETNVEQANLNLGVVEVSTNFRVKATVTTNRASASLNGGALVTDTSVTFPGLGAFWIKRSYSGEAWDGTINRLTVLPNAISDADLVDPLQSFIAYGDSTATAPEWRAALANSYTPVRTQTNNSAGGENSGQMLARVTADTVHRQWNTIFMDLPNTGETFNYWIGNVKAAAALIPHDRWYVHPPAQNSPGGTPLNGAAVVTQVQQALLSDPFFQGHTLNAEDQAAYLAAVNDDATRTGGGDFTHFNSAGQAIQAQYIRAFFDY